MAKRCLYVSRITWREQIAGLTCRNHYLYVTDGVMGVALTCTNEASYYRGKTVTIPGIIIICA